MNDELDKLKKAFAEDPDIKPSKEAKKAAINAAMSAFEQENVKNHQGNSIDNRLKGQDNKIVDLLTLSKWRKSMKLNYLLPGAAGLAALALVAVNTHQFRSLFSNETVTGMEETTRVIKKDSTPAILEAPEVVRNQDAKPTTNVVDDANRQSGKLKQAERGKVLVDRDSPDQATPALKEQKRSLGEAEVSTQSLVKSMATAESGQMRMAKQETYAPSVASAIAPQPEHLPIQQYRERGRDNFEVIETNPLKLTQQEPVSTFSIDVDTASYSFVRASLNQNVLPPKDAVRVEELINYFPYNYAPPKTQETPFSVATTVLPSPWNAHTKLLHIGIKGYELPVTKRPSANLVFLLDTSGSMNQPNKLPLLKNSFKLLLSTLSAEDTVSIVAYAGSAGTVLEPTKVKDKAAILSALSRLRAGGSTAGGEGIRLAYQLAETNFDPNGVNRVILATDGDFNVGIRNQEELKGFVERKRQSGVLLSVLGFGMGNYNDALMQTLAQNGNGNAAYIDSLSEARKVLVDEASSTLFTIAKDVKIQMEFNPEVVSEYRLIGYETRQLKREDFNNDKVDAGDIGAGHSVTAIYEITPTDSAVKRVDDLRYQTQKKVEKTGTQTEYGFLKMRYKLPESDTSQLIEQPVLISESFDSVDATDDDVRFAVAVAAFGQLLRGGQYTADYGYEKLIQLAQNARGEDPFGYRAEFMTLVRLAQSADALQAQ